MVLCHCFWSIYVNAATHTKKGVKSIILVEQIKILPETYLPLNRRRRLNQDT